MHSLGLGCVLRMYPSSGLGQLRRRYTLGRGAISPQMWHKTLLFDELEASAYRCKKEHSVSFSICQNVFPAGAPPRTPLPGHPSRLGRGHFSTYPTPVGAFCTSIFPLSTLAPRRLDLGDIAAKYFSIEPCLVIFKKTPPYISADNVGDELKYMQSYIPLLWYANLLTFIL